MPDDLLIARNPEAGSTLPFLIRVPLGPHGIVVKARQTWPRESKVYCHRAADWPWTYRWLGACLAELTQTQASEGIEATFAAGPPLPKRKATAAEFRAWAKAAGLEVSERGGLTKRVREAFLRADSPE